MCITFSFYYSGILFEANETHPFCGNLTLSRDELLNFYRCVVRYREESVEPLCQENVAVSAAHLGLNKNAFQ